MYEEGSLRRQARCFLALLASLRRWALLSATKTWAGSPYATPTVRYRASFAGSRAGTLGGGGGWGNLPSRQGRAQPPAGLGLPESAKR